MDAKLARDVRLLKACAVFMTVGFVIYHSPHFNRNESRSSVRLMWSA